ncbi:MAG: hypothetical protein ACREJ2_03850, partial [Planctomycetota bacterium]
MEPFAARRLQSAPAAVFPAFRIVRLLPWLAAAWLCAARAAATLDQPVSDEVVFQVADIQVKRSTVELEFLAEIGPDQAHLSDPQVADAAKQAILQRVWKNSVDAVIQGTMLRAASDDEVEFLNRLAQQFPQQVREATDQRYKEIEARMGGPVALQQQLDRFHVTPDQLHAMILTEFGIDEYLYTKFRDVSESTPRDQIRYYHEHPLEFALSGRVRLQRLAVRPLPDADGQALEKSAQDIAAKWSQEANPDGFAAVLAKTPLLAPPWTVIEPMDPPAPATPGGGPAPTPTP